jgi:pilus assembly protein FimV
MRSKMENKNESQLTENSYEEIADIRETIAESTIIDGEESFEENSVVELDLKDFEELGAVNNKYLKSMTIIDEFENDFTEKNTLPRRYESSKDPFNIEQFTIQIDSLTSVKKRKKIIMPVKPIVSKEAEKEKIKEAEVKTAKIEIKDIHKIEEIKEIKEIQEPQKAQLKQEAQEKQEKSEIKAEIKEIPELKSDIEQILQVTEKVKNLVEELKETKESKNITNEIHKFEINESILDNIIENKLDKLHKEIKDATEAPKEEADRQPKGNSITIEIPDKLAGELPAGFNIDELGKIDLNEAEVIAEEDLLSLTRGELFKELEGLNILPEQIKETQEKKETIYSKAKSGKDQKIKVETKDIAKEEILEKEKNEKIEKAEKAWENEEHDELVAEKTEPKTVEPEIITAAKNEKDESIVETVLQEKEKGQPVNLNPEVDTKVDIHFKQDTPGIDIKDENVFIIDNNKSNKTDTHLKISGIDELEDITSNTVDVIGGNAKQLTESDVVNRKAVTGLIRDNYPTFKDLLKEKETKDKHLYSDDDITFVDNSIFTNDKTKQSTKLKDATESKIKEKIISPYEQILGLIPDELELIENQLFNKKLDLFKTTPQKAGLDQHPSDTISLSKYKYILPVPDSLLDDEKKSIENDIRAESALIFEEDVAKIKKKLDDSMKKEITETINDITDRITIYEDNNKKQTSENNLKDKEEIKKLLGYLDDLFEKLPEENIKNFADSEYYELYKKLL